MAGTFQRQQLGSGGGESPFELLIAQVTLVAGTQTITLPEMGYRVCGLAVVAPGAGARGNLSTSIVDDVLTVTSDAATEVSTVRVMCWKEGAPTEVGA